MGFHVCVIFHNISQWTLSKVFLKSMKLMTKAVWNSMLCSMMFLNVRICSMQDFSLWNPACSSCNLRPTDLHSLLRRMIQNTFPGTDGNVIPLQLLQSDKFLFSGSFIVTPCLHSLGTCFSIQCVFNRSVSASTVVWLLYLRSSGEIWPYLGDLFLSDLTACDVSVVSVGPIFFLVLVFPVV